VRCFGTGFFEDRAARDDDVATATVHLEDLEGLRNVHQRGTSRTGRMSTCEPGRNATAPFRSTVKPPLTRPKITPSTRLAFAEFGFQLVPGGFAASAVAAEHRLRPIGIFDAVDENFDFVADLEFGLLAGSGEFAQRHAAFALEADVDDGEIIFDGGHGAFDDTAFER
jgi:hypothetical protein